MDKRILDFINALKKELAGMPEAEVSEAVSYYEEYLTDAAEAGADPEELLQKLSSPQEIAASVRAESKIARAQRSPGLKNFTGILGYAFRGVTTPFMFFFVSIFVAIAYGLVITFFAAAFVLLIGALGFLCAFAYEAAAMPARFLIQILGTLGMGIFLAAVCFLLAFGMYRLGRLFIVLSTGVIRKLQRKNPVQASEKSERARGKGARSLVIVFLSVGALGLILMFASGLPITYFTIFNSMKPAKLTAHTMEYAPSQINKISLFTANSQIVLKRGDSDKITLSYEQPAWMDYESGVSGSMLSFYEKSSGMLPLFDLAKLHEGQTELVVSLPEGYSPQLVALESTGGHVRISDSGENIQAKTYTGNIILTQSGADGSVNIKASTELGSIEVYGKDAGQKTSGGLEYYNNTQSDKTAELESSRGNIEIS